jgi:hypothetical protein
MATRAASALTCLAALVMGVAGHAVLNEAFTAYSTRFVLTGHDETRSFHLPVRAPLFLEYELVLRTTDPVRRPVLVTLNDAAVAVPPPGAPFSASRANVPLPFDATREGDNVLRVRLQGAGGGTFELRARVHNYYGIAPDFPRAVVVSDEAVTHRASRMSVAERVLRVLILSGLGALAAWLLPRWPARRSARARSAQVLALLAGPLAAVAFGAGRPLHLWLSAEALAVVVLAPWAAVSVAVWALGHRAAVLAVATMTAVTLVTLEGGLRLVNRARPTFLFYTDSYTRYRGQPGARFFDATFNRGGFNDVDHPLMRPDHVALRVVALGDSFAVGVVPQRDNYLTLLETMSLPSAPVEVINLGVAGTEPRDYLAILVDEGLRYSPDLVLLGFFIGNDFETRAPRPHERSFVATLIRALWRLGRSPGAVGPLGHETSAYDDAAPGMPLDRFMEVQVDRAWIYERGSSRLAEAAGRAAGLLADTRDLARRNGADLLVVLLPDETQVDADLRRRVAQARDTTPEDLDLEQPNRLLTQALRAAGIEVLDLLPAFAAGSARTPLYKPQDSHWNLAGNRLAAEVIFEALEPRLRPSLAGAPR